MTEIEKLKKEIEDLKLIIESKNNQVESKNNHIKRLERIISNMKKNNLSSSRGAECPELTSSKFQNLPFLITSSLDFQAGAFLIRRVAAQIILILFFIWFINDSQFNYL